MNLNNLSICRIHVVSLQNELVFTYKSPEKFGAFYLALKNSTKR